MSGNSKSSSSFTWRFVSVLKNGEHTAYSWMGRTGVSVSEADGAVGVVTTAISAVPSFNAAIACGVEWLLMRIWMPGWRRRNSLSTGSSRQRSATSLAATYTVPVCSVRLSVISASPASICSNAMRTWAYKRSPSGVNFMPRFVRRNSGHPSSASRFLMARVMFGWLFKSCFAACERLPYFAT